LLNDLAECLVIAVVFLLRRRESVLGGLGTASLLSILNKKITATPYCSSFIQ